MNYQPTTTVNIHLVLDDWRKLGEKESIYLTEQGVELTMGVFHHGSAFNAIIELESDDAQEFTQALQNGYVPVFWVSTSNDQQPSTQLSRITELERELTALRSSVTCEYCGTTWSAFDYPDHHWRACEKHPARTTVEDLLAACEGLMRSALAARNYIVNAPELRFTNEKLMPAESLYFTIRDAQAAIAKARGDQEETERET